MSESKRIIIFNKPYGVLSSFTDSEGQRPTLQSYIPIHGVYAAGRLDFDSEGLLLLTDDGELAHQLTAPDHKVSKTYLVQVEGVVTPEAVAALAEGVVVKGYKTRRSQVLVVTDPSLPERSKPVTPHGPTSWLRIVLREGKKRQIRHMTAAVGFPTLRIVRLSIGNVSVEGLNPGEWRDLTVLETNRLRDLAFGRVSSRR